MLNIGFRAHDFGKFSTPEDLARAVTNVQSPSPIQLALNKSFPSARPWTEWTDDYIASFIQPLNKAGVTVGVVGAYINPVNPDEDLRRKDIERYKAALSLHKAFGCRLVGTETGSWNIDNSYSRETSSSKVLSIFYRSLDEMLNQAIKSDAICAIEPVAKSHTICSVERTAAMLEKFNDEHLGIIYDPINLLPWIGLTEEDGAQLETPSKAAVLKYVKEGFDAFGSRIVAIHCKDFCLDDKGFKIFTLPAPTGHFDWSVFFSQMRERNIDVPVLLENLNPATVKDNLATLKQLYGCLGCNKN
jgi:Xylose isomerase-like TIM barrel.